MSSFNSNISFAATSRYWQSLKRQTEAMPTVFQEEHQVTSLGDIPLLILVSTEPNNATHKIWKQANIEMANLSTHASYQIINGATHMSLAYRQTDAQVCTDGILKILEATRLVHALQ